MSGRATLALIAVFVALVSAYWFIGQWERTKEREAFEAKRLFDFESADLGKLRLEYPNGDPVEAAQTDAGSWDIIEPHDHITPNNVVWNRVAEKLAALTNERLIAESPEDLSLFELTPPHLTAQAEMGDGQSVRVSFGGSDPTQQYRYTRVGDGPIVLTPKDSFSEINRSLLDLRDRRLAPVGETGIQQVEYARIWTGGQEDAEEESAADEPTPEIGEESVRVRLERGDDGAWYMTSPARTRADQERVQNLVSEVHFATGRNYIDDPENLGDYGLAPASARITVWSSDGDDKTTFYLGWVAGEGEGEGIFVKREDSPSVFVIDGHILTLLPESPDAFRETTLFTGEASELESIEYTGEFSHFTLFNDAEEGWKLTEPAVDDTDQVEVTGLIRNLKLLTGLSFPENPSNTGLDNPKVLFEFTYKDGREPASIAIGNAVPDTDPAEFYVRQDRGIITTIPFQTFMALRMKPFDFRDKAIFEFPVEEAVGLDLRFEGTRYKFTKRDGQWTLEQPPDFTLETQDDVVGILEILQGTEAKDIALPAPEKSVMGLGDPVLRATVRLAGEEDKAVGPLEVGELKASKSRERFTRVAGRPEVFFVDQGLIDDLRGVLRGIRPN